MNLGWNFPGRILCKYSGAAASRSERTGNKLAIWSAIDLEIVAMEGEKLNDAPDGAGADSEQLTAQHNRAASAIGERSLLFARLQHFII